LAYTASRISAEPDFKKTMAELRNACDFCHARFLKVDKAWVDPFAPTHERNSTNLIASRWSNGE
jgi:hypothetical protein